MSMLRFNKYIIPFLVLFFSVFVCQAQSLDRPPEHKLVNKVSKRPPGSRKQYNIREPLSVSKAKRKQAVEEKKREKEYKEQLKDDQKRHLEIQTPEVRERILQNRKDADTNYKAKKKAISSKNKKARKKYR